MPQTQTVYPYSVHTCPGFSDDSQFDPVPSVVVHASHVPDRAYSVGLRAHVVVDRPAGKTQLAARLSAWGQLEGRLPEAPRPVLAGALREFLELGQLGQIKG